ncbi:MAG: tetratricopeptide repeat protein [Deltaproteobacteria bacterium]|nr:tetratricopeptide repeat protein [Deltaproteobacteria bacterium]
MALPDPELELLREMLLEDPGSEVFRQVGRELIDRGEWDEAVEVLVRGLDADGEAGEGWELLVEAAVQAGQYLRARAALEHVDVDPTRNEAMARAHVLTLEAVGKVDTARAAAERFLEHHVGDVVVQSAMGRLTAPPPDHRRRAADPLVSVRRAEEYVALGRPDRAIRVYRRLHFHFEDDLGLPHRINELRGIEGAPADDLSEEISREEEPQVEVAPPGLTMPLPGSGLVPDDTVTETNWVDEDDELTQPAIDLDVEEIRSEIERRMEETATSPPGEATPAEDEEDDTEPFTYGEDPAAPVSDEEETVMMPSKATEETPKSIARRIKELREKRRRSLLG